MVRLMKRCAPPPMPNAQVEPDLRIVGSSEQLADEAARVFADAAARAASSRGRFLVALSGGGTPQALFSVLARPAYSAELPWAAIHFFWGDERLVPPDDAGSNYFHAKRLLFDHVPAPAENIHRVRGELEASSAVEDYERILKAFASDENPWPRFDLALLGLGADGHTASLFPGSDLILEKSKPVAAVTAEYENRPAQRITLTPPVFNDARQVMFLVAGASKSNAVEAVLQGPSDAQLWPAQAICPHPGKLTWLVDQSAAQKIH
jgi:6-phosphogluconolactonase